MASLWEMLRSFIEMIVSVITSIVDNLKYAPKIFEVVTLGLNNLLQMFNELPPILFAVGSVTLFIAFWFLVFGR